MTVIMCIIIHHKYIGQGNRIISFRTLRNICVPIWLIIGLSIWRETAKQMGRSEGPVLSPPHLHYPSKVGEWDTYMSMFTIGQKYIWIFLKIYLYGLIKERNYSRYSLYRVKRGFFLGKSQRIFKKLKIKV